MVDCSAGLAYERKHQVELGSELILSVPAGSSGRDASDELTYGCCITSWHEYSHPEKRWGVLTVFAEQ
eukprot:7857067-Pyramimonas_sp.AAC.1